MGKKIDCICATFLGVDIIQNIYDLGSNFYIGVAQLTHRKPRGLELHIKLVEEQTKRYISLDKVTLLELCTQLRQFEKVNISYPCTSTRNLCISVKLGNNPGDYLVHLNDTKLTLDSVAVKELLSSEKHILKHIGDAENFFVRGGYDFVG